MIACLSKAKNKANPYQIKNYTLFKRAVFVIKILSKIAKKQVHKGYPLAGPCICNSKLELALAIKNNPSGSSCFFPSSLVFLVVVEWFQIVIARLPKAKNKATLYQIKNFTLFKRAVFFIKILSTIAKKQVHKGYPLAGPCICNSKLELALAIKNNPSGSSCFFPFFLSVFSCG